ncbi:MAG TPA: DEAD/DEAH box helicase family protein [Solirubrobacteraceae bacterium]|jgi:superfamily II DNA or RNA helicase
MASPTLSRPPGRALPPWPANRPLRAWQRAAAAKVLAHQGPSFLASATPAAGKTTFGLHIAHQMLTTGRVRRVAIIAPTTHICRQWAADAARYGIDLEPNRPNAEGPEPRDRHGVAVTYQTVAAGPAVHRRRAGESATLVIADEPHHMGEQAAWGLKTSEAFAGARFRLLLSGTPFRSDNTPIPWVTYDEDGVSSADFTYTYTDALLDGVCRPVTFQPYDGDMEWMSDGRRRKADFSIALPAAEAARRLRTALDPEGDWVAEVLRDADTRLNQIRAGDHPEAGALVVAVDKEHAEKLADRLARITGTRPPVVTSDAPDASARIARFSAAGDPWLVSVLMVSEGVDIPRLRVGVYATAARTELFFRQVVGRFIRRTPVPARQMSYLYLPADRRLKTLAVQIEEERNHALELKPVDAEPLAEVERVKSERDDGGFHALWSSGRPDDEVLQTTQPGDALQLFGAPEPPSKPSAALAAFTATPAPAVAGASAPSRPAEETAYERRERLREERQSLVSAQSRRTGEPHRALHARINRATGAKSVGAATAEQLEKGNRLLEKEARKG